MDLVYKKEKLLFALLLGISLLVWAALLAGTKGLVLAYGLVFLLFYLFAQSAFISYLKGTGVQIRPVQFPDLHERITTCCQRLGLTQMPDAYLLHMGGAFNALATRFLGRNFIVLYSDVVDALESHPDALNFYIGHEIGHIKRNHLRWGPLLFPASILPLLGAAYARAREYTCDRHGVAACDNAASAALGLGALAAGGKRWRTINGERYVAQASEANGFWMSLHELISDYPWLTKRVAAVQAFANGAEARQPGRHPLAWLLALFIPRFGVGGGAASGIVVIAMMGIAAAVAIPAYQQFQVRARMVEAVSVGRQAAAAVEQFYMTNQRIPQTLEQTGFVLPPTVSTVSAVRVDPGNGVVQVTIAIPGHSGKSLLMIPSLDANNRVMWKCGSRDLEAQLLPRECRG